MKIGELAQQTACKVETIRYYELQGLLPEPTRTAGNYRDYGPVHLMRLQFIRNCRSLGMAHEEIKELLLYLDLPQENCQGVSTILDEHIEHVNQRIIELTSLRMQLQQIREKCATPNEAQDCGILQDLTAAVRPGPRSKSHL